MPTIRIKNIRRQPVVCNLETPFFRDPEGDNGAGKPESVTWMGLEIKTVPEEVLECVEVKAAMADHGKRQPSLRVVG